VGEFELIESLFARLACARMGWATVGIGDDCALLPAPAPGKQWAVSTDMLISGTHFFPDVEPDSLGHKSLAVNLSDLAAMGATPKAFTLSLALPAINQSWLQGFTAGLDQLACAHEIQLVGGDTTKGPLAISITVIGEVDLNKALRRDGAQYGDDVWVSGSLGGAALGLHQIKAGHPGAGLEALVRPQPRVKLGQGLVGIASAAIDVSDGLVQEAGHIAHRSRCGVRLFWHRMPLHPDLYDIEPDLQKTFALAGGDDYELLFTAPVGSRKTLIALGAALRLPLTRIGEVSTGHAVEIIDERGQVLDMPKTGFDHFLSATA
jgi:thiamine-monophosphate kinase